jgi:hypothetical protein
MYLKIADVSEKFREIVMTDKSKKNEKQEKHAKNEKHTHKEIYKEQLGKIYGGNMTNTIGGFDFE